MLVEPIQCDILEPDSSQEAFTIEDTLDDDPHAIIQTGFDDHTELSTAAIDLNDVLRGIQS